MHKFKLCPSNSNNWNTRTDNQSDKLDHFGLGTVLFLLGWVFWYNFWYALLFAFVIGVLWEVRDGFLGEGFSYGDIIADSIGILFGGIALLIRISLYWIIAEVAILAFIYWKTGVYKDHLILRK